MEGQLHALPDPAGWYPALVPGPGRVLGMVHRTGPSFGAADLARIDAYEDHCPDDPAASEYLRRPLAVFSADPAGPVEAWGYVYNRPLLRGARPIPGGDFAAWLAATGLPAYAPPG